MANILFLIGDIGPAEGAVYSDLKRNAHQVFTYSITGRWVPREDRVPLWMNGYKTRLSPMARNWFIRATKPKNIDFTITSGLSAAAFAANNVEGGYYPLLWRGNLDFQERNRLRMEEFAELVRTSDRLLLEDSWEMDKAVSKNSRLPHLRMRYPSPPRRSYLTSTSGNIAIIYRRTDKEAAETLKASAEESFGEKVEVGLVDIKSLYRSSDIAKGLDFYETLTQRLKTFSYAIILGTGPHHSTVVRALAYDKKRMVVEQSIGMSFLSDELELPHRARGLRCVQEMKRIIEECDLSSLSQGKNEDLGPEEDSGDFLDTLQGLWQQELDEDFEELPAILGHNPLNIFFSVGTLQNLTKGARHQRVRNMHDAFSQMEALNIYGSQPFFARRLRLALKILKQGRLAGVFYGENSTSPMTRSLNTQLAYFLDEFSRLKGSSMWFVRDLHWLEDFENSPWTEQRAAKLRADGLYELSEIGDRADILAAPSSAAAVGFNKLLTAASEKQRSWHPLPPAVHPQNVVDDNDLIDQEGTTLLYAGGISEIYGMQLYLSALQQIDESIMFDFVVREPEAEALKSELDRVGLLHSERTRILHTTMDLYRSRTSRTLGIVLLDSEYAKFSFPYKTITMVERGYPILCYSDMGIADFVTSNNVGLAVERSVHSVLTGINTLIENGAQGISKVREHETWENRAQEVYHLLS